MLKKLINTPEKCVDEALEGVLLSDSRLLRVEGMNILVRADINVIKERYVTIISGGGSGHEPAHAGFIGDGMLSAVVLGNVFASPSVAAILAAIRVVAGSKGVLLIVKNYTGDRLNFGMAAELAKQEGVDVQMVIVADDCALPLGKGITGGRGLAGTIFVHKVAGSHAARGAGLAEVHAAATSAASMTGTLGVALTTCTVPGTPASTRLAKPGLIEVGMGIHGEPGREQMQLPSTGAADAIAEILLTGILNSEPSCPDTGATPVSSMRKLGYSAGQRVVVMVNNLGSLPVLELQIVTRGVLLGLQERGLLPVRAYVGAFMTSLEMCGVSLSLLIIDDGAILDALDDATAATAWVKSAVLDADSGDLEQARVLSYMATVESVASAHSHPVSLRADRDMLCNATSLVCQKIVVLEYQLTAYDAICGDGDCGVVMKRGAECVIQHLDTIAAAAAGGSTDGTVDLGVFFTQLADSISASMGGTSGALIELCFRAMASEFRTQASVGSREDTLLAQLGDWTGALAAGVKTIGFYGGASEGMRTMLDALIPAVTALEEGGDAKDAAAAAMTGMTRTAHMHSLAGRSNYVANETLHGTPDPGAFAVAAVFAMIAEKNRFS